MKKILTIGIIQQGPEVLLGMKLRGFGVGLWNGPGGKFDKEKDKNPEESFSREALEEAGLIIGQVEKVGLIEFEFADEPGKILETHVFRVLDYEDQPRNSEEMQWQWFGKEAVPFDKMWPADKYWLPIVLAGKKVRGYILYSDDKNQEIISKDLREVSEV
jgi:8-oxo-dGTP pyrophosphatase MutT (NUDIX family)